MSFLLMAKRAEPIVPTLVEMVLLLLATLSAETGEGKVLVSGGAGGGSSTTTQGFNGAEGVAYVELWYVVPNV